MASAVYLPNYQPYSTVQSSMQNFMGDPQSAVPNSYASSPIQYNMPLDQLRQQSSPTTLNGPVSSQDRIQQMADRRYEKILADRMVRERAYNDFNTAQQEALGGMTGVQHDNYSSVFGGLGRGSSVTNPYSSFMSNQGGAGLFGGSVSSPTDRYRQWNESIYNQQNQYNQAMAPVYARFGVRQGLGNAVAPLTHNW